MSVLYKNSSIVVFSAFKDLETDYVLVELNRRGIPFVRINSFDLTDRLSTIGTSKKTFPFDTDKVNIIWNRMPFNVRGAVSLKSSYEDIFADEERYWYFQNMFTSLENKIWVNPQYAESRANCKSLQLEKAKIAGFNVPATIMTNNPDEVKELYKRFGRIVYKPIFHSGQISSDDEICVFTNLLSEKDLNLVENVKQGPGIFQQYIEKDYDLRIIVIGKEIFPIRIESQDNPISVVDWKRADFRDLQCNLIKVDQKLESMAYRVCYDLGIMTAAIDMVVAKDGKEYFLELNPAGRWLQFEIATGTKIRQSLADLLSDPSHLETSRYKLFYHFEAPLDHNKDSR